MTTSPDPYDIHIIVEPPSGKRCVLWNSEISLTVSRLSSTSLLTLLCGSTPNSVGISPWKAISCCRRPGAEPKRTQATHLGWLEEIYSKIWNRPELKPTLFRKVVVTRGDYDTLQDILNQKFTERDSALYDGREHDVLGDKLDFLRSLCPAETHIVNSDDRVDVDDGPEAITEDDFEINSFFPSSLNYLDLSTLGLKSESNRIPMPVYFRHEYNHISELIKKDPQNSNSSFIISGQPGTGEVLVSCLAESNRPCR